MTHAAAKFSLPARGSHTLVNEQSDDQQQAATE